MTVLAAVSVVLAKAPPADKVKPGLLGFLVVLALGVVTYLLWRSMNRQLRKVDFEEGAAPPDRTEEPPPDQAPPPAA